MRPVLGQPTIPRLHVTELAFDDAEGMLDLCTHLSDDLVDLFVDGVSWTVQPPTERKGSDGIMIVMLGKMKNVTKYVTVLLVAPPTRH